MPKTVENFLTHWVTITLGLIGIMGGLISGILAVVSVKTDAREAKSAIPRLELSIENLSAESEMLGALSKDYHRLTQESLVHRSDKEIHMSKEQKQLLIREGAKALEENIMGLTLSVDRLMNSQIQLTQRIDAIVKEKE